MTSRGLSASALKAKMDACKPFSIQLNRTIIPSPNYDTTSDDSDEDDDLPPNPFTSPMRPVSKERNVTPPKKSNIGGALLLHLSPALPVNEELLKTSKLEKDRKHNLVKNLIVKRKLCQNNDDAFIEEHLKDGGIMAKRAKRVAKQEATSDTAEQPIVDEAQDFNTPPGLSVFVVPISFVAEIDAPPITNKEDPFEADLLTAPLNVLRELVISNTILSMFCQKPVPATMVRWLLTIMLMSNDRMLSQAAFSVLTCLLHQSQTYSLSPESFHITYSDIVKIIIQYGASSDDNGDITSEIHCAATDFKMNQRDNELLINNLNNFIKYLVALISVYPQFTSLLCPNRLLVLLLRLSLDHHIIDSCLNISILQCISAVLSCYSVEEWDSAKMDKLSQSFLGITDDPCNWCRITTTIGNITGRCRELQKWFARTVLLAKTPTMVVPAGDSNLDFVMAFIRALDQQSDLNYTYCLLDILSMFVSPLELSKEKDNDLSNLVDQLSLLSSRIHDNPNQPITGFVKDSILRLRNVLTCVPGQKLQQQSILAYVAET